jgi:hypothetical protein
MQESFRDLVPDDELVLEVPDLAKDALKEAQMKAFLDKAVAEAPKKELTLKDVGIFNRADARAAGLRMPKRERLMKVPKKKNPHPTRRSQDVR